MTREEFESLIRKSCGMREIEPDRSEYWTGFIRGARRSFYGTAYGTAEEHEKWLSLSEEEISSDSRRQKGQGYRDGLIAETPFTKYLKGMDT